jgi:dephospho-CoA kinase
MLKVGLTGGIGSGKSTVAEAFRVLGVPVYNADSRSKLLVDQQLELKRSIIAAFGDESYLNGVYNRRHIASIVFQDAAKLSLLNSLIHPYTIADAESWFAAQHAVYAIKEAAILFESGADKYVDVVIGVTAPMNLKIERIIQRDGITAIEIIDRMSKQMDDEEKMKLCDLTIINDETASIIDQVLTIHETLLRKSRAQLTQG